VNEGAILFALLHGRRDNAGMSKSNADPSVDECRDRLHRAGWSLGEVCFGATWQVDGTNGENKILATGATQAEAWYRATLPARALGTLAPAHEH
jgi:hypothetical protein